jgi:dsRNA-specific ribonuclease/signal transduction histidine kinase
VPAVAAREGETMRIPFPSQLEPFLVAPPPALPVPASAPEWSSFALFEESSLKGGATRSPEAEFAASCLEALSGVGASLARLLVLEIAYQRALPAGQTSDLYQRLGRPLVDELASELSLLDFVVGEPGLRESLQTDAPLRRRIETNATYRLLAALAISGDYDYARTLVSKAVRAAERSATAVASYKTALQEILARAKRGRPSYSVLGREGPDHALTFHVAVTTPDGRSAEGVGLSKRKAEEQAARSYLATRWGRELEALERSSSSRPDRRAWPGPRLRHDGKTFTALAAQFRLPESALPLLSLALTHKGGLGSVVQVEQWQSLAQLGAAALEAIMHGMVLEEGLAAERWVNSPGVSLSRAREGSSSRQAFEDLRLDQLLIAPEFERTDKVKADAFQAVVAVALLVHREAAPSLLPPRIDERFRSLVRQGIRSTPREMQDAKTVLQTLLAPMRVEFVYDVERTEGLPNDRTFYSRLTLMSRFTGDKVVVRGGTGRTRIEADKDLASRVVRVLMIANGMTDDRVTTLRGKPAAEEIGRFLLDSGIAALKGEALALGRLAAIDALGASSLRTRDPEAFARWVEDTESLLGDSFDPDDEDVLRYFRHLGSLADTGTATYTADLAAVVNFVRGLDPENYDGDLREREGFKTLLALAAASRLRGHAVERRPLDGIVDEIELLHRGHAPTVRFERPVPECMVSAREGVLQALVEEVVKSLAPAGDVVVSADLQDRRLTLTLVSADRPSVVPAEFGGPLWHLFSSELPGLEVEVGEHRYQVRFGLEASPPSQFAAAALRAFRGSTRAEAAESEALAHLLHDLKNRLIGFHLALAHRHSDQTARLKAQLDASQHLDASLLLCDALSSIGSALAEPEIGRLDIGRFFRDYFAEKFATLPANVEIDVPSRADGMELTTSTRYLRSILDNLIKNAVEAMPDGGRIRCEWIAEPEERRLLVEVADSGRGIAEDDLESLLSGRGLPSRKKEGSGVGMMTVVAMVGRLGGTISGESGLGTGTRWMIELPSVPEDETTSDREPVNAHPVG